MIATDQKLFLAGIGGMGMAPLALYLAGGGRSVMGTDDHLKEPIRQLLCTAGIEIRPEISADCHLLGYSSAISLDHPICRQAVSLGIPLLRRGQLLASVLQDKSLVAIVGSHGKSTTTSMLIHMLQQEGFDFGYLLGALFREKGVSPARFSASPWVVAEIDESDGTINEFFPDITLVVNLDWDHVDYYASQEELEKTFMSLFERTKKAIFVPGHCRCLKRLGSLVGVPVVEFEGDGLEGNQMAALSVTRFLSEKGSLASLSGYRGICRRQEVLFQSEQLTVLSDYAHHPREVKVFLEYARRCFLGRLIVVFQPHRYSRTRVYAKAFAEELAKADEVYLLPVYSAFEVFLAGGASRDIYWEIKGRVKACLVYKEEILEVLSRVVAGEKRVVAFVGAGDLDEVAEGFVRGLG